MVIHAPELHASVLGGVRLRVDGDEIALRGTQRRRIVSVLLLHAGSPVQTSTLLEACRGDQPAPAARDPLNAVHAQVRRLRQVLADHGGCEADRWLTSGPSGYELRPDSFDLWTYEALLREASRLAGQDPSFAIAAYRTALDMWAAPWEGAGGDIGLDTAVRDLELRHLSAEEAWADLALDLDRGDSVADVLLAAARRAPTREVRWTQAMSALFQADRQAEALRTFDEARSFLREELGVEPSESLRQAELAVLRQADPFARSRTRVRAFSVPVPPTSFVGREEEGHRLDELVGRHRIVSVVGLTGVGKTRLVGEWARTSARAADVRFVDLTGASEYVWIAQRLAEELGLRSASEGAHDPLDHVRGHLSGKRTCLVLDTDGDTNDVVAAIVADLCAAVADLTVVTTTRFPLGLSGEVLVPLAPLPVPTAGDTTAGTAVQLAAERLDDGASVDLVRQVAVEAGGIPMLIELAAATADPTASHRIRVDIGVELDDVACGNRLTTVLGRALAEVSPTGRQVLRRTAAFPGGTPTSLLTAVSAPDSLDHATLRRTLRELVSASLLRTTATGRDLRYTSVARSEQIHRALGDDSPATETYLAAADWFEAQIRPTYFECPDLDGLRRLNDEHRNVAHVVAHLLDDRPDAALALATVLADHWEGSGRIAEGRECLSRSIEAATPEGPERAAALLALVHCAGGMAAVSQQLPAITEAVDLLRASGDTQSDLWAVAHVQLSIAAGWNGDGTTAVEASAAAGRAADDAGSEWMRCVVDRYALLSHVLAGNPGRAFSESLVVAERFEALGDPDSAGKSLYIASIMGRMAGITDLDPMLAKARQLAHDADSPGLKALIAVEIAQNSRRQGRPEAEEQLETAALLLERAGNLRTAYVARRDLAFLLADRGATTRAMGQLILSATGLIRADERAASLAVAGMADLADDDDATTVLAESARWLADQGTGSPLSAEDMAVLCRLIGDGPARRRGADLLDLIRSLDRDPDQNAANTWTT